MERRIKLQQQREKSVSSPQTLIWFRREGVIHTHPCGEADPFGDACQAFGGDFHVVFAGLPHWMRDLGHDLVHLEQSGSIRVDPFEAVGHGVEELSVGHPVLLANEVCTFFKILILSSAKNKIMIFQQLFVPWDLERHS